MNNVRSIITNHNTRVIIGKARHKSLVQTTVTVGTRKHVHYRISA